MKHPSLDLGCFKNMLPWYYILSMLKKLPPATSANVARGNFFDIISMFIFWPQNVRLISNFVLIMSRFPKFTPQKLPPQTLGNLGFNID